MVQIIKSGGKDKYRLNNRNIEMQELISAEFYKKKVHFYPR